MRDLKAFVESQRSASTPYEIALSPPHEEDKGKLKALAEAGMTWLIEYVPAGPPEQMRARVARGPVRIE